MKNITHAHYSCWMNSKWIQSSSRNEITFFAHVFIPLTFMAFLHQYPQEKSVSIAAFFSFQKFLPNVIPANPCI